MFNVSLLAYYTYTIISIIIILTDAVEANISASSQFCAPVGGSVSLVAFTNIAGNPYPTSSWELIGGTLMGDTTGRQLNISDLDLTDSGNYTNTLTNTVEGTENRMNRTIELQVLSEFINCLSYTAI